MAPIQFFIDSESVAPPWCLATGMLMRQSASRRSIATFAFWQILPFGTVTAL